MAYNNYYQPWYYSNPYYQQQIQNQAIMQQQAQQNQPGQQIQQPAIQQTGFVLVQSEQEARSYPVAPGNSITFKDESGPYCYVKTMGFNQFDRPVFEKYRLVKEESQEMAQKLPISKDSTEGDKDTPYALKSDLGAIWREIDDIKDKLRAQAEKRPVKAKRSIEIEEDESNEK